MRSLRACLSKDLSNTFYSIGPAVFLSLPLLVLIQWTAGTAEVSWQAAYWIVFFICAIQLFYRSFGLENRFSLFALFSALRIRRQTLFWSQVLAHIVGLTFLSMVLSIFIAIFWNVSLSSFLPLIGLSFLSAVATAPVGTLLGLILQLEREFLFSLFFLPLSTPVILACYSLSTEPKEGWIRLLVAFMLLAGFASALLFEFFFDEVSELD